MVPVWTVVHWRLRVRMNTSVKKPSLRTCPRRVGGSQLSAVANQVEAVAEPETMGLSTCAVGCIKNVEYDPLCSNIDSWRSVLTPCIQINRDKTSNFYTRATRRQRSDLIAFLTSMGKT